MEVIKSNGKAAISLIDFIKNAGNKTVFSPEELTVTYENQNNIVMMELVYNGYFGKGHNVIHKDLNDQGLFTSHSYQLDFNKDQFIKILEMGDIDVQNVIIG
ncbi:hypothetical protein JCM17380_42320 [Desulfosporosinus burensis]